MHSDALKKDCDAWRATPLVNPRTGRRIKKNGPTYKVFVKECDLDDCEKWRMNHLVNPTTGRRIKENGPTYKALIKDCEQKTVQKITEKTPPEDVLRLIAEKASPKTKMSLAASSKVFGKAGWNSYTYLSQLLGKLIKYSHHIKHYDITLNTNVRTLGARLIFQSRPNSFNIRMWAKIFDGEFEQIIDVELDMLYKDIVDEVIKTLKPMRKQFDRVMKHLTRVNHVWDLKNVWAYKEVGYLNDVVVNWNRYLLDQASSSLQN